MSSKYVLHSDWRLRNQGRRHEVSLGGGDGFTGTEVHLPQKFSFSSDLGHFILKMLEDAKFSCVKKKYNEIS